MFIIVKIVGLFGILAIAVSAHPIVKGIGDVAVPLFFNQNRTTSTVQEIAYEKDNKSALDQLLSSKMFSIESMNDVQNDGTDGGPDDPKPDDPKPDDPKPEDTKPDDKKPEVAKPTLREDGDEATTPAPDEGNTTEGGKGPTTEGGNKSTTESGPDNSSNFIRASTAVLFPFLLVLVKCI